MKRCIVLLVTFFVLPDCFSQTAAQRVALAYTRFEADSQLSSAVSSLYVVNAQTGEVVFEKNARIGLAPASTQKIITAATAYELLGKDFRYQTQFATENISEHTVLHVLPSGDPTLGSWRWEWTKDGNVLRRIVTDLQAKKMKPITDIVTGDNYFETERIPDGWIWQDIGNYYGAGAAALNWRENQFDLYLRSGTRIDSSVAILGTKPLVYGSHITSYLKSAAKGTGDNAYLYYKLDGNEIVVRGTIPVEENKFVVSGSFPSPARQFAATLADTLRSLKQLAGRFDIDSFRVIGGDNHTLSVFHTEYSPSLDSLVYWFLKKSINLYGEALVRTLANQKGTAANTQNGVRIVKNFWKEKGIALTEINMVDGSGLSPLNRVTTHAQVAVLQYAKKQSWFGGYYHAFPEYNGMKMKSGTINGAKGFCGYQLSRDGSEYIFSFLVNNYNGSASTLIQKMYKVLDELK